MSPITPNFSIVVATHNRQEKLRALLDSIRTHRTSALHEIVIVDDSESRIDLEDEYRDLNVRHLHLDQRLFSSRAKNIGWRACSSEFVYFIDDDNVVTETTLNEPCGVLAQLPETAAIMPSVLYKVRPDLVWVYSTPLAKDSWRHLLIGRNRPRDPAFEKRLLETDALPNASVIRRIALEQIGGFNEEMTMSSSADAVIRLKRAGWRVYAFSGAFTLHDVEPPGRIGFWAAHGTADPERVFFDVRDWFLLMRVLHPHVVLFRLRASRRALGFMLPNGLSYTLRGGSRGRKALVEMVRGFVSGLKATSAQANRLREPLSA